MADVRSGALVLDEMIAVAALLALLTCGAAALAAPARRVNWYVDSGRVDANAAFIAQHAGALTGMYLCCNGFAFAANGTFGGLSAATVRAQTQPLYAARANLTLFYVAAIDGAAVHSGAWAAHVGAAADAAVTGGFAGFIVDYEPDTNYTAAHARAYAAFLTALATALHTRGKRLGFDTAGWGILDYWGVYKDTGADIFTSMTPTYDGTNVTLNEEFVDEQVAAGVPVDHVAAGIGTMLAPGQAPEWDYNWTQPKLSEFATWLGAHGVAQIDFWRADIDSYKVTASWYFDIAAAFLDAV